jgi:hypothetical protein
VLGLSGYDPVEQNMKGGGASIQAKQKLFYDGYLVTDIKPGTYVFRDMSRQDRWALCFHDNSLQFTVKAGEALYLGEFESQKYIEELETVAITTGRVVSQNSAAVHFFDNITPPSFGTVSAADLTAVAAMMKARMPKTTVAPKAPTYSPARFGTGNDLFGLNRVCGGYYTKKAKPKAATAATDVK